MKWIVYFCIAAVVAAEVIDKGPALLTDYLSQISGPEILGWIPLAQIDIAAGDDCPVPWKKITENGISMCRVPGDAAGCYSAFFSVGGQSYTEVVGAMRGYQKGSTDAFGYPTAGINGPYVDGVSITMGMPRKHVWTYAVGVSIDYNYPRSCCPCAVFPGANSPPYVGENFYCQSGCKGRYSANTYYTSNPLWQGFNCTEPTDHCCAYAGLPVFHRSFTIRYNDDIEVRICTSETFAGEAVLVDQLYLFIR